VITADQHPLPVPMPTESRQDGHLTVAADVLGWRGIVLPRVHAFGDVITVVAELDDEVHADRVRSGWPPVTDRTTIAMWSWPEHADTRPAAAMRVVGVLASGARWQQSVKLAARYGGFGSTALITESARKPSQNCLLHAQYRGVGVVWFQRDGAMTLASPGRVGPVPTARPTDISRWFEEVVYACALRTGKIPAHADASS